jgi:hypothetical protein
MPPKENPKEEEELERKIAQKYLKYDQKMLEERLQLKESIRVSESLK